MIGKTILHYKIIEKLGEGGMGVVYLAEDNKLKRQVAIKFLPHHITANSDERKRFEIEAQAAAALNHPNIATIHAIEETEEDLFLVMEYISGKHLKDHINGKPLPVDEAIDIASQVARGLQAAHKKGIVHRDIKSANIMSSDDGRIKVMDFGLAKFRGSAQLTQIGTTVGTAAYMSPEQARGEEADQRSDIWSFGIVFYEMLTGQLPFRGDYDQAIIYSMLNEQPEALHKLNPAVASQLTDIVDITLKKDPIERYQEISFLLKDLEEFKAKGQKKLETQKSAGFISTKRQRLILTIFILVLLIAVVLSVILFQRDDRQDGAVGIAQTKSRLERLAILPFVNLKSDPETDFLGYALADQIIGAMAYVKNISVRASSAVRKYQNEVPNIAIVGHDLQVDYVLTGNYLKQDNLVRLNVELVNVNTNELIWREPIEVKYENAFTLQDIVSKKVMQGLQLQFSSAEEKHIGSDIPQDPLAFEYYLKGISYPFTAQNNQLAVEMLEKSIELDSVYAPAYEKLGDRLHQLASYKFGGMEQIEMAEKYFLKASSLNPDLLSALGNLALIYTETSRTEEAVELTRKMLKINPNNPDAHFSLGYIYRYVGMLKESGNECDIAISLDPKRGFRSAGITYMYLEEYKKAAQAFDLDPESSYNSGWKGQLYLRQGQQDLALEYLNQAISLESNSTSGYWAKAMEKYLEGKSNEGISVIKLAENKNQTDSEVWYNLSNVYGLLGDKNGCINALRKAVDGGYYNYPYMLKDHFFDSLRDEPEFKEILAMAKQRHEAFKEKFFTEMQ
jgi:eukaryotic-like serine/threonine-protein kinase